MPSKTNYQLLSQSKFAFEKATYTNIEEGFKYQVVLGEIPSKTIKKARQAAERICSELQICPNKGFQIEIHGCRYTEKPKQKWCGLRKTQEVSIVCPKIMAADQICSEEIFSLSDMKKVAYAFFKEFHLPAQATLILSFKN